MRDESNFTCFSVIQLLKQNKTKHCILYYRCINLLVKVHLKNRGEYLNEFINTWETFAFFSCLSVIFCILWSITDFQPQIPAADVNVKHGKDLCTLQRMKGLSLAWRGISFTQMDQLREALRDLQLSLQAFPGIHATAVT